MDRHSPSSSPSRSGVQRLRRRRTDLVQVASPFPAVDGVPARPRWWHRLRGLVGMSVLVVLLGALVAVAIAILLALAVVALVSILT